MDETLDDLLPPLFVISNSALKVKSLKNIVTFIEVLKNFIQLKMDVVMCPILNVTKESVIMRLFSHYSI